jgi:hypothetical protein
VKALKAWFVEDSDNSIRFAVCAEVVVDGNLACFDGFGCYGPLAFLVTICSVPDAAGTELKTLLSCGEHDLIARQTSISLLLRQNKNTFSRLKRLRGDGDLRDRSIGRNLDMLSANGEL